jgi:hypothetical protein
MVKIDMTIKLKTDDILWKPIIALKLHFVPIVPNFHHSILEAKTLTFV